LKEGDKMTNGNKKDKPKLPPIAPCPICKREKPKLHQSPQGDTRNIFITIACDKSNGGCGYKQKNYPKDGESKRELKVRAIIRWNNTVI
jgi:hypothetical protein